MVTGFVGLYGLRGALRGRRRTESPAARES
jgi:hypothetical protein